jgi:hypothetical protein
MDLVQNELLDRYTDQWIMDHVFRKCNITLSLKKYKIPDSLDIIDLSAGKVICTIRAKSVHFRPTWNACPKLRGIDTGLISTIPERATIYEDCLLHKPKGPYLSIHNDEDLSLLRCWIIFSACIHTEEQRFRDRRIDPDARESVRGHLEQRAKNEGMSQSVGHARKHGEDVVAAISAVYHGEGPEETNALATRIETLPALPMGVKPPVVTWLQEELKGWVGSNE